MEHTRYLEVKSETNDEMLKEVDEALEEYKNDIEEVMLWVVVQASLETSPLEESSETGLSKFIWNTDTYI